MSDVPNIEEKSESRVVFRVTGTGAQVIVRLLAPSGAPTRISPRLPNLGEERKPAIRLTSSNLGYVKTCGQLSFHTVEPLPCAAAAAWTRRLAGTIGNEESHLSRNKRRRLSGAPAREAVAGSELNAFERILAALHEAALDPACWPGASALIDEALGTHGSTLACGDGESEEDYRLYFMWTCHRGQRRRDLERLWMETYHPVDEAIPRVRRLPFYRLFPVADLYTEEERKSSESYNALRTLAHAGHAVNVRLEGPDGSRIMWQINDPVDGEGWSTAQRDWIRRLLPHVRQTVHVRQTLARADALGATLTEMLDRTGLGIVQLDARGRIVAANDRARDALRIGNGLLDSDGFLLARAPRDNDDLQALLSRALPPFGAQGIGGSTIVRRPGSLPPFVACEPGEPPGGRLPGLAGGGAGAGRGLGKRGRHRSRRSSGGPRSHRDGEPGRGAAGPGHERAPDRDGDGPQGEHHPFAREAHVRQARTVAPGAAGAACAILGRRSGG